MLNNRATILAAENLAEAQGRLLGLFQTAKTQHGREMGEWLPIPPSLQAGLKERRPQPKPGAYAKGRKTAPVNPVCFMITELGPPGVLVDGEMTKLGKMIVTSTLRDDTSESEDRGPS